MYSPPVEGPLNINLYSYSPDPPVADPVKVTVVPGTTGLSNDADKVTSIAGDSSAKAQLNRLPNVN